MESATFSVCSFHVLPIHHVISRMTFVVVGLLLNSLLLVGLMKDPQKGFCNFSSYLVANLCVSDILTCIPQIGLIFWRSPCVGEVRVFVLFRIPLYVSASSVLTLAYDRYMSCYHPLKYKIVITKTFTKCVILLQWLFCIVESTLEMFYEKWLFYPRYIVALCIILSSIVTYAKAAYVLKKKIEIPPKHNGSTFVHCEKSAESTAAQSKTLSYYHIYGVLHFAINVLSFDYTIQ